MRRAMPGQSETNTMTTDHAALPLLDRLIAFPSVSASSNLDLIQWIAGYLENCGVASRLTFDDDRRKANLLASIGTGGGGIMLSGHTDVVPVDGQQWSSDPFLATIRDGRVYGRGTCDMKGFIAVVLALVPKIVARTCGEPVHFAFSYDEEVGCLGVRRLIADLSDAGVRPRACVIGEPTGMRVIRGHKGAAMYVCEVRGRAAHSSIAPAGVNAIEYAALLIAQARSIADRLKQEESRDAEHEVPHSTIQVNRIDGGTAGNIVADHCRFLIDVRNLPCTDRETLIQELRDHADRDLLPEMRQVAPEATICFERIADIPPLDMPMDDPFLTELMRAAVTNQPPGVVSFGTEGGLFQQATIPTLICGPGSIDQAHRPDEFVEIEQLDRCKAMLCRLLAIDPTDHRCLSVGRFGLLD